MSTVALYGEGYHSWDVSQADYQMILMVSLAS
jgi:hypothetical protein